MAWLLTNNKPSYFELRMIRETPTPRRHLKECYLRGGRRKRKLEHVLASLSRERDPRGSRCWVDLQFSVSSRSFLQRIVASPSPQQNHWHPPQSTGPGPPLPIVCWPFLPCLPPTAEAEGPTKPVSSVSANFRSWHHCLCLTAGPVLPHCLRPPLWAEHRLCQLLEKRLSLQLTPNQLFFFSLSSSSLFWVWAPFPFSRTKEVLGRAGCLCWTWKGPATSLSAFLPEHCPRPGEQEWSNTARSKAEVGGNECQGAESEGIVSGGLVCVSRWWWRWTGPRWGQMVASRLWGQGGGVEEEPFWAESGVEFRTAWAEVLCSHFCEETEFETWGLAHFIYFIF